jgi:glycerophosphoryl diester phosphodiesterase
MKEAMFVKKTLLLAHRGFSGAYPENSPLAFRMAVEKTPADGFESDVHLTKDGKLVIFHDDVVNRTSNGHGYIKDHTYDEMLQLDIGAWKGPEFAGEHVWTLEELLDFCRETRKVLNMELKNSKVFYEGLEQRVIDEICRRGMQEQVFVSSFNHVSMQRFKELCPDIETGLLYGDPLWDMADYLSHSNADNIHPCFALLQYQPELVELFHSRGMKINVWTANEEADIRDMLRRGVDGIISNYPDLLCRVAGQV